MNDWHQILQRSIYRGFAQRLFRHVRPILTVFLIVAINIGLIGCGGSGGDRQMSGRSDTLAGVSKTLQESPPPNVIQLLSRELDVKPQVNITRPKSDQVLQDARVTVQFEVADLPAFKDDALSMGPHLHMIVDNQPYQAIYNPDEPLTLEDLDPGTHTIRVFASRPWHESFKNAEAYDQVRFHLFTRTPSSDIDAPLLTYSRPKGSYGSEPVMLDFYLNNVGLPAADQDAIAENIASDWKVRCTINGQAFTFDIWEPVYLKGLKPGNNWVQLELLDGGGNPIPGAYNNTARLITMTPDGDDTLSKLMRDELPIQEARAIVVPGYEPPPATLPTDVPVTPSSPMPEPSAEPIPAAEEPEPNKSSASASNEGGIAVDVPEPADLPNVDEFPPGLLIEETLPEIAPAAATPELEPEAQTTSTSNNGTDSAVESDAVESDATKNDIETLPEIIPASPVAP